MKKGFLFVLFTLAVFTAAAQDGYQYQKASVRFREFYNRQQGDSIYSMYSPAVKEILSPDKTKLMIAQLHEQFGDLQSTELMEQKDSYASYKATFTKGMLTILLSLDKDMHIGGLRFIPYHPEQAAANQADSGSNFTLKTASGTIYGTLVLPEGNKKVPVVLIIAGSGATDRNGNSPSPGPTTNMYEMLADSLLQKGIASLRYDKRGVGQSKAAAKSESEVKFEDYINDAAGLVKMLKADDRFSKVVVLGHSEGALIGMVAAGREKADAYISVAGAGERIDKTLERQLEAQSPGLAAKTTVIFDSLRKGYTVQPPPGALLMSLFRPSVQPFLISWLQYNPQQEIGKLKMPVLLIQGTTDLQISVDDAQLLKKAKPDATLELVDGMNHVLKQASADRRENGATYNNPGLPLKGELVKDIETFIQPS
jgi:pimeloyl-ACP methyl ester carboxylesterase